MDARYTFRKSQVLDECQVAPEIFEQVIPRLYSFMKPLSKSSMARPLLNTPKFMSVACCRLSNTKTSNPLPIVLANLACRCKASLGGTRGMMRPCERS